MLAFADLPLHTLRKAQNKEQNSRDKLMVNAERRYNRLKAVLALLEARAEDWSVIQMNLLLTGLVWSFFALFFVGGCGDNSKSTLTEAELDRIAAEQKMDLPDVLVVAGETITCDEIIGTPAEHNGTAVSLKERLKPIARTKSLEEFKEWAEPQIKQILTTKISNILLYQQAKRQAGEDIDEALEKPAEREWRGFVLRFEGDEAKAEEALKQMGLDRQSFKDRQKRAILTQSYIASKLSSNKPITHRELIKCYNQMKEESFVIPAMIKIRLIDIQPAKLEAVDPNQSRQDQAKKLIFELLARLREGEDFGELAKQYSHGTWREYGGLWKPLNPESFAEPYDILAAEAEKMEPGQITGMLEKAGHIFIMKLEEKRSKSYEPLEKVQDQIEQKIISERWKKAVDELNFELMEHATLDETNEFIDFCLEKIYQMKEDPPVKLGD